MNSPATEPHPTTQPVAQDPPGPGAPPAPDSRRRRPLPPVFPPDAGWGPAPPAWNRIPLELPVSLGVVLLLALGGALHATLLVTLFLLLLTDLHRRLFQPHLALAEYAAALADDLEAVVRRVRQQHVPALAALVAVLILVALFPHPLGSTLGATALLALLWYSHLPSWLVPRLLAQVRNPVEGTSSAIRSRLNAPPALLALPLLAILLCLHHLLTRPWLPLPGFLQSPVTVWITALLLTVAAFLALCGVLPGPARTAPLPPGRAALTRRLARLDTFSFDLALVCAGLWFSSEIELRFPLPSPPWNGLGLGLAFVLLRRLGGGRQHDATPTPPAAPAWGAALFTLSAALLMQARHLESEEAPPALVTTALAFSLVTWHFLAALWLVETRDPDSGRLPPEVLPQLTPMAGLLVAFLGLELGGLAGLCLSLFPVTFMALNTRRFFETALAEKA